jgi:kynurenine aminotransferase
MAGAKVRFVPLEFKDNKWSFNPDNLKTVLSDKTKVLILNNAHNPTGKLFTDEELHVISDFVKPYPNLIVLSDDVYEYLVFDGKQTILFASIDDNWNRTISVFSGGKLFSATGWKIGWGVGPADLINAASVVSTTTVYCVNAPA